MPEMGVQAFAFGTVHFKRSVEAVLDLICVLPQDRSPQSAEAAGLVLEQTEDQPHFGDSGMLVPSRQ
jgi:hypothetical protein